MEAKKYSLLADEHAYCGGVLASSSYCVNQNIFVFQKTFLEVGKGSVSAFIVIKTGTFCLAIVFIVLVRPTKASY